MSINDPTADARSNGSPIPPPVADLNGKVEPISQAQLHELMHALQAVRVGDFTVRMAADHTGILGKIADTFNEMIAANQRMAGQLERVGQVVGRERARPASACASG